MSKPVPVARIDIETNKVTGVYNSCAEAARHNDLSKSSILRAIHQGTLSGGYGWARCRRKDNG